MARTCQPKEPFVMVPVRVIRSKKLNVYDKAVFGFIASFNPSFPSIRTIAGSLKIASSTVQVSIQNLISSGVLKRVSGGRGKSNGYTTNWEGGVPPYGTGVPPHGTEVYRHTVRNQIKESDQLIRGEKLRKTAAGIFKTMPVK